ncbi:hypothetical protein K491DRAFT_136893 [Lophiostoma macrostomum CBS 122681]|uniref:Uncharacterized protein n=1 Tax=Lophiostoma macrostomum CBS 122681 TaxID=1314788 RepID=A0A6A6TLN8_9PLEO|nr:hypothetical protein K491DRAFT_136893 [Lophiostoma macrostomum CBS 122681]
MAFRVRESGAGERAHVQHQSSNSSSSSTTLMAGAADVGPQPILWPAQAARGRRAEGPSKPPRSPRGTVESSLLLHALAIVAAALAARPAHDSFNSWPPAACPRSTSGRLAD